MLPDGGSRGGVTTWARRTTDVLVSRGRRVCVVGPGVSRKSWGSGVRACDVGSSLRAITAGIQAAAEGMAQAGVARVVVLPQLSGSAYAASFLAAQEPAAARLDVIGWMHTDIRHDVELIRRFLPGLAGVVCVSESVKEALSDAGVDTRADVHVLPTGCPSGPMEIPSRPVWSNPALRLLYVGRLDAFQKRALTLPLILAGLRERGVFATLTVAGDGPARAMIEAEIVRSGVGDSFRFAGVLDDAALGEVYRSHDLLLQPSRSEGQGLARIEASMLGCVPVVTPGGSSEGIVDGLDGIVVRVNRDAEDAAAASAFVRAIAPLTRAKIMSMSDRAIASSRSQFCMERFADRLEAILGSGLSRPEHRRAWAGVAADPDRAASFTVPENTLDRVKAIAARIGDRPVALHGAGAHTVAIWRSLMRSGVRVVAICDDDPERWGGLMFGVPVAAPAEAARHGAAGVLISSWLHEDAIWAKRDAYVSQGLEVLKMYAPPDLGHDHGSLDQRGRPVVADQSAM